VLHVESEVLDDVYASARVKRRQIPRQRDSKCPECGKRNVNHFAQHASKAAEGNTSTPAKTASPNTDDQGRAWSQAASRTE